MDQSFKEYTGYQENILFKHHQERLPSRVESRPQTSSGVVALNIYIYSEILI